VRGRRVPSERIRRAADRVERRERERQAGRTTRRRYLARRWLALLVVLTVVAIAYLVMFTSLLGVRSVDVLGTKEIPPEQVREAAAIELGTPMVRLAADEAATRVAALPRVAEVVVERSWPSTVEIIVTERTPVAVQLSGDGVHLIDGTGFDYATEKARPEGLPELKMSTVTPDDPATHAAVSVLAALPKQLRPQVAQITAPTPGDVRLLLADGRTVRWGDARNSERKGAVLAPLLTRPGTTYDVTTPDFPTVS
jgi:cell division protein FtsQ